MKNFKKQTSILLLAVITSAFTSDVEEKKINVKESTITWKGHKVTGSHEGNIKLQEGLLMFSGEELIGGEFVVDMSTINNKDLSGEWKEKLEGHLKSDDFFNVGKHPTALLKFTKVKGNGPTYNVVADLTIKGITNPVNFDITLKNNSAEATFKIDRTNYDIKYGSASFFDNLKDKAIYNEFDLIVNLVY